MTRVSQGEKGYEEKTQTSQWPRQTQYQFGPSLVAKAEWQNTGCATERDIPHDAFFS